MGYLADRRKLRRRFRAGTRRGTWQRSTGSSAGPVALVDPGRLSILRNITRHRASAFPTS